VIFTNESNIERWKNKRPIAVDSKTGRLDNFMKLVEVPVQVFIACDVYKGKDDDNELALVDPPKRKKRGPAKLKDKPTEPFKVEFDKNGRAIVRPPDIAFARKSMHVKVVTVWPLEEHARQSCDGLAISEFKVLILRNEFVLGRACTSKLYIVFELEDMGFGYRVI
nr:polynucleotide 3'-phosphatase ZDP [Tanacetum cinerariifolium]